MRETLQTSRFSVFVFQDEGSICGPASSCSGRTYIHDHVSNEGQEKNHEDEDRIQDHIRNRHIVLHLFGETNKHGQFGALERKKKIRAVLLCWMRKASEGREREDGVSMDYHERDVVLDGSV